MEVGRLQEAVAYGRQLMEEPYALQEDVEKAAALIYQRIDELELPDEPDVSGGDGSESTKKNSLQAEKLASCLLKNLRFTAHDIRPKSG